jgi:DNA polymerase III subunit delta'
MWQTAGQDRIIGFLTDSIKRGSLAHAYLFTGPPHVGKMTLAIDLARTLNCNSDQSPCDSCRTCQRIAQGKHPDVIMIDKNAGRDPKDRKKASEIGIDTIREHLQRGSSLPPYEGKYKVYIIEDADLMSVEAANCLLKTLEEPPNHVVIILLTAEENVLLPTVISRCQRFELKPVSIPEIESRLSTNTELPPEKVRLLARLSGGCLGWALSAVGDDSFIKSREARLAEFVALISRGWDERISYIQQLPSDRKGATEIFDLWISWCRDVMLMKYTCENAVINLDHINDLKSWSNMLTVPEIKDFIDCLNSAVTNLSYNANLHLVMEVIMLDMPRKEKRADSLYSAV